MSLWQASPQSLTPLDRQSTTNTFFFYILQGIKRKSIRTQCTESSARRNSSGIPLKKTLLHNKREKPSFYHPLPAYRQACRGTAQSNADRYDSVGKKKNPHGRVGSYCSALTVLRGSARVKKRDERVFFLWLCRPHVVAWTI